MSDDDLCKFMVYTLLLHDFSILSTQNIANIGAKILTQTIRVQTHESWCFKAQLIFS